MLAGESKQTRPARRQRRGEASCWLVGLASCLGGEAYAFTPPQPIHALSTRSRARECGCTCKC